MRIVIHDKIDFSELRRFRKIRNFILDLSKTKIEDKEIAELDGLSLTDIWLPEHARTDIGLSYYLEAVEPPDKLTLSDWRITDGALIYVSDVKNIQVLDLDGTPITDHGLIHLTNLKNLHTLYLSKTQVTDEGIKIISTLRSLQKLYLFDTRVTAEGLSYLAGMKLKALSVPTIAQNDVGLKHFLAAIESPTTLRLYGWRITDSGLKALADCKKLKELHLVSTQATEAGVAELRKALPGCLIYCY